MKRVAINLLKTLLDHNYGRFRDRLRVLAYPPFLGVSRAAINRYFNLIGISLTVPSERENSLHGVVRRNRLEAEV